MSDILIKNMEMPSGDDKIMIVIESDGSVWQKIGTADYFCIGHGRAMELPDHGDLIDKDSLKESMRTRFRTGSEIGYMQLVDEQKVILPSNRVSTEE